MEHDSVSEGYASLKHQHQYGSHRNDPETS